MLSSLPYFEAIYILQDYEIREQLWNVITPEEVEMILSRLIASASVCALCVIIVRTGSVIVNISIQFRSSAALLVAEYLDDLAKVNKIREDKWKGASTEFEKLAYESIASVESDHLLFVLLNIPLIQHDGQSLCEIALEQNRTEFLNS